MPLTIPPFSQFQAPLVPLRGLWNARPAEGDYFINAEIDWIASTGGLVAQQFNLSGNSPVALSQIAALYVDNRRCGVDCNFQFPDSGFLLTVPAHTQALAPVFTNALMFYASAPGAASGDVTVVQVCNSVPPPIQLIPTQSQQAQASGGGFPIAAGTTVMISPPIAGTLNDISISGFATGTQTGPVTISILDGNNNYLWSSQAVSAGAFKDGVAGLDLRFQNGLKVQCSAPAGLTGQFACNLYVTTP